MKIFSLTKSKNCAIIIKLSDDSKTLLKKEKIWRSFEKGLDKNLKMWYNGQVAVRAEREFGAVTKTGNHSSKKFEKVWKKDLTNLEKCGIIRKLFEWRTALHLEKWTMLNKARKKKKLETLSIL